MDKRKKNKRTNNDLQSTTEKKLKIEQHEPHKIPEMNSGAPEELVVPVPLLTPVMIL